MTRDFPISADHGELWGALYQAILMDKSGPLTLRFLGWEGFEQRMPRYARRLKRLLLHYYQIWPESVAFSLLTLYWE